MKTLKISTHDPSYHPLNLRALPLHPIYPLPLCFSISFTLFSISFAFESPKAAKMRLTSVFWRHDLWRRLFNVVVFVVVIVVIVVVIVIIVTTVFIELFASRPCMKNGALTDVSFFFFEKCRLKFFYEGT